MAGQNSQIDLFAPTPEPTLADQPARDVIARVLEQNVVVRAGAGAGKTHELLTRMVECIRRGVCTVDEMVAITFTRKAAGELKQRFALTLEQARQAATGDEEVQLTDGLRHIDDCFIGTIHAFCARMLRERPVEAGLPPDFTELDERDDVAVRNAAWDLFIEDLYAASPPLLTQLLDVGVRPHQLVSFFETRYEFADLELKPTSADEPDLSEAVVAAGTLIQDSLPYLKSDWTSPDGYTQMARRATQMISRGGMDTTLRQAEFLAMVTSAPKIILKHWKDNDVAKQFRDERIPEMNAVVEPALRSWREYVYTRAAPVADAAVDYYRGYRRRNGLVTFYDLLERSVALLREHPEVRRYFQRRYKRLFVDEFQDTDPLQAEMLLLLTSTDLSERDWRAVVPMPGSLFIVGDEKQSIYRFRRADIETFRAVTDQIEMHGGRIVQLTTSFRTLGGLCGTLNNTFREVFQTVGKAYQAPFAPLSPARPEGRDSSGIRRLDTSEYASSSSASSIAEAEASRVAAFVAAALSGDTEFNNPSDSADEQYGFERRARPSDFLIIARERANLGIYARALERAGIPYDISGGDALGKSEELAAVIELLSVIERPHDPVAYACYLRGLLVGVSDAELYAYRKEGGTFNYRAPLSDELIHTSSRIAAARETLVRAERLLTSVSPFGALAKIVDDLGLVAYAAGLESGTLRAGSLLRAMSYVRQWTSEGKNWVEVLSELRGLSRDLVATIEMMTLEVGRPDVVRIMTVHQAKGLQAPVVILADAGRSSGRYRSSPHVSRVGGKQTLSAPAVDRNRVLAQPSGWEEDDREEQFFREAEEDRVRYVGATRARNLLVVCEYKNRGFWYDVAMRLASTPELPRCPEPGQPPTEGTVVHPHDLAARMNKTLMRASEPTVRHRSVTGSEDDARFFPVTQGGRGPKYGSAVHRILEAVVQRPETAVSETYVADVLARETGAPPDEAMVREVLSGLDRLRESALWRDITRSASVYTEVPVTGEVDRTLYSGVIDLVFAHGESWRIVDYKTDAVATADDLRALGESYADQVKMYATFWNRATGQAVTEAGLWSFSHGSYLQVALPEPTT